MIQLRDVSFTYTGGGDTKGLSGINLTIGEGETVVLCGESGCGKTTLTRLVNGLVPHYYEGELTGEVLIKGNDINTLPLHETAEFVGSVFQNPRSQFFNVDTDSELAFGCENRGLPEPEIRDRIMRTISDFRIESLMNRNIFQLSGGEKQKIACASVSVSYPEIFALDEPSSNLDLSAIEDLRTIMALWKSRGKTLIVAEHRLYYLRELADRFIFLERGSISREFSAAEMKTLKPFELANLGLRPIYLDSISKSNGWEEIQEERLELSNFRFSYKRQPPAVNIDTVTIPRGSVIAVIGPNGSGKSTFAKCLCGLMKRFKGVITKAEGTHKGKKCLQCCYMVMQDVNHQLFAETVLDEVLIGMKDADEKEAEGILGRLDLLPLKEKHPMSLSGGQKQRVAIAGAVATDKEIVIFDEPTSGLDLRHMREVSHIIRGLREAGKTQFVISHDPEFIMECCDYVLHFKEGKIHDSYPLDEEGQTRMMACFL